MPPLIRLASGLPQQPVQSRSLLAAGHGKRIAQQWMHSRCFFRLLATKLCGVASGLGQQWVGAEWAWKILKAGCNESRIGTGYTRNYIIYFYYISNTVQGGDGNFKNKKFEGKIDNYKLWILGRIYWWIKRKLFFNVFIILLYIYLFIYLVFLFNFTCFFYFLFINIKIDLFEIFLILNFNNIKKIYMRKIFF